MTPRELSAVLASIGPDCTHRDAERMFREAGWTPCGAGDWAFALASPGGDVVARISPFDPVGPYTARLYAEAAQSGQVPELITRQRLLGGGDLQVMERLTAVPESEAEVVLGRFAEPTPELEDLAAIVARIHRDAQRHLPWCGPLDTNPSNVMRASAGGLVLTDPFYADGENLYATAEQDPDRLVALIPADERRFMTEIPLTYSGPWAPEAREALREKLRLADERTAEKTT